MSSRAELLRRFYDETEQPPGYVAMRCSDHGRFMVWVWPPLPDCRISCPPECGAPADDGPALRVAATCPRCRSRNAADLGNGYWECFGCGHGWAP